MSLSPSPGHPCLESFRALDGYALSSLTKEELRKQSKSVEASKVIWMELAWRRKGLALQPEGLQRGGQDPRSRLLLYVRAPRQGATLELEMSPLDSVELLKKQIAVHEGTAVESQRLVFKGATMQERCEALALKSRFPTSDELEP